MKVCNTNIFFNNSSNKAKQFTFKAVSIDPDSLYKQPNGLIISDGDEEINILRNNGVTEEINKLDNEFQTISEEMRIRRKIEEEKPLWRQTKRIFRNINKRESFLKNQTMDKKDRFVSQYSERVDKVNEITDTVSTKVTENNVDPEYKRLKANREFDDYKGSFTKANGFKKIAGYDSEKSILYKYFISEIKKEQKGEQANVPNAVLFFGPTGNGKTTFAKAFANETGCRLVPIRTDSDIYTNTEFDKIIFKTLIEKAQKAEEHFQKTGVRSIIFIDEITKVADKQSSILPELADFFANCSKKYHCTMFCASNHPLNIGLPMEGRNSVFPYIVSIDPPNLDNKAKIMQYYLNGRVNSDIDYDKLAEYMDSAEQDAHGIYNISQIKDEICLEGSEKMMTEGDIKQNIDKTSPNINQADLDKYSEEMDKLIRNEIKD